MLVAAARKETASDPVGWTEDNPLAGHCAVVSLVAQDLWGGSLLRASLEGTEWAHLRSHYWNELPGGEEDFTEAQFGGRRPKLVGEVRTREYLLTNEGTRNRYLILRRNLDEELGKMGLSLEVSSYFVG